MTNTAFERKSFDCPCGWRSGNKLDFLS